MKDTGAGLAGIVTDLCNPLKDNGIAERRAERERFHYRLACTLASRAGFLPSTAEISAELIARWRSGLGPLPLVGEP